MRENAFSSSARIMEIKLVASGGAKDIVTP